VHTKYRQLHHLLSSNPYPPSSSFIANAIMMCCAFDQNSDQAGCPRSCPSAMYKSYKGTRAPNTSKILWCSERMADFKGIEVRSRTTVPVRTTMAARALAMSLPASRGACSKFYGGPLSSDYVRATNRQDSP
jgi:hypothetical protein